MVNGLNGSQWINGLKKQIGISQKGKRKWSINARKDVQSLQ